MALVEGRTGMEGVDAAEGALNYDATTVSTEGGLEAVAQAKRDSEGSVRPARFKALVGRGHQEFSSARQQDAEEYLAHLLEVRLGREAAPAGLRAWRAPRLPAAWWRRGGAVGDARPPPLRR